MNALTSVEAAKAVSANAIGLPMLARRRRGGGRGMWTDARIDRLCALLGAGYSFDQCAETLDCSRSSIAGQVFRMRKAHDDRLPTIGKRGGRPRGATTGKTALRRFGTIKAKGAGVVLAPNHPAAIEGRPLFVERVKDAGEVKSLFVGGHNNRKIGKMVMKGPRRGWPIYTLTLPERATCPRSCEAWLSCYGNGSNWAIRIRPDARFEARMWTDLAELQRRHARGFLVRIHVLGDFYSEAYAELWDRALDAFPALHVFGFTARDPDREEIGSALWAMAQARWDRFAIRFSGRPGATRASRIVEPGEQDPAAVSCPAQTGATDCCATCGLCFHPSFDGSIAFVRH